MSDGRLEYTIKVTEVQNLEEGLKEVLNKTKQLMPVYVVASSDHAAYLEYGTGPVNDNPDATKRNEIGTSAKESISAWAMAKFPHLSISDRKRLAYAVYRKIMTQGMDRHPFMAPAADRVKKSIPPSWFDEGKSVEDIGKEIVREARSILSDENRNWTWDVYYSIHVVRPNMVLDVMEKDSVMDKVKGGME